MFSDSYFGTRRVSFDMSVLSCVYKRSSCKILKEKLEETFFFGGGSNIQIMTCCCPTFTMDVWVDGHSLPQRMLLN